MVTHKDKEHIHNHLVVNSVSFENGLKYNASNKSLWDIKRESNRLCERENLKTLDLDHKAEKRISSAEKRIMDRGVNDNITMNRKWKIKMYKNDH